MKRTRASWEKARKACRDRAQGACEAACTPSCTVEGWHAHHVRTRAQGGSDDLTNLLWVCASCHGWIHANPEQSYTRGWLRRTGEPVAPVPPMVERERWAVLMDACRRFDEHANRDLEVS